MRQAAAVGRGADLHMHEAGGPICDGPHGGQQLVELVEGQLQLLQPRASRERPMAQPQASITDKVEPECARV
jgi:hypothetical protein